LDTVISARLAVVVRDPLTGKVVGGLYGRPEFGLVYVEWLFLPEDFRRRGVGSRVLATAEEEARQRGCTRIALTTLSVEAQASTRNKATTSRQRLIAIHLVSRATT
jgi:GNAT superfamily N-acetyltransferase